MRGVCILLVLASFFGAACAPRPAVTSERATVRSYPRVTNLDLSNARSFDATKGEVGAIRYVLSAPAKVRLRIVDSEAPGIILRTLLDWAPRPGGESSEIWDGKDRRGEPVSLHRVSVVVNVEPIAEELNAEDRSYLAALSHPEIKHFLHPVKQCADLDVRLKTPATSATLSGEVMVSAALEGALGMPNDEYHAVIYLDGRDAWDGRVSDPQVNRQWDTRNIPNGEHLLAITFDDLNDHAGSDWHFVTINNP